MNKWHSNPEVGSGMMEVGFNRWLVMFLEIEWNGMMDIFSI